VSDPTERLIAVLERIADTADRILDQMEDRPPPRLSFDEWNERERQRAAQSLELWHFVAERQASRAATEAEPWEV